MEVPEGGIIREWEFAHEVVRKQTKEEYKVTGACIDEERKLEAKFLLKGSQGKENSAKETKIQLQSLRGRLSVVAYRKWNFETLVLEKKSPILENRTVITYVQPPKELGSGNGVWGTSEPMYNLEEWEANRENW